MPRLIRSVVALLVLVLVLVLAGCGPGTAGRTEIRVTVTDDFGAMPIRQGVRPTPAEEQSVLDLLHTSVRVATRPGAPVPQAVEGVAARGPLEWSVYVNGVTPEDPPSVAKAHGGDHIWLDRHDRRAAPSIPAVVGSFPEPFRHGLAGERLPVRIECAEPASPICRQVVQRFTRIGVIAAPGKLRGSFTEHTLRVLVGTWAEVRVDDSAAKLEQGPRASGVFARPTPDGRSVAVLDARGGVRRVLGAGTGLVAATEGPELVDSTDPRPPLWLVTGTDDRGVLAAVRSLTEQALANRFALAVTAHARAIPLPSAGS
jgi:hypothetical protein